MYAAILRIEQNHAKSIQARNFTSGEILGFRMISSLNGFRPKFWTEGDLGMEYLPTFTQTITPMWEKILYMEHLGYMSICMVCIYIYMYLFMCLPISIA